MNNLCPLEYLPGPRRSTWMAPPAGSGQRKGLFCLFSGNSKISLDTLPLIQLVSGNVLLRTMYNLFTDNHLMGDD